MDAVSSSGAAAANAPKTSISFAFAQPKVVGIEFQANEKITLPPNVSVANTLWSVTISYTSFGKTYTTPPLQVSNSNTLQATAGSNLPGTYTFTAVTSYASTLPNGVPPAATTTTRSTKFAAPDKASKGGGVGAQVMFPMAWKLTDPVTAGGLSVGPIMGGTPQ